MSNEKCNRGPWFRRSNSNALRDSVEPFSGEAHTTEVGTQRLDTHVGLTKGGGGVVRDACTIRCRSAVDAPGLLALEEQKDTWSLLLFAADALPMCVCVCVLHVLYYSLPTRRRVASDAARRSA